MPEVPSRSPTAAFSFELASEWLSRFLFGRDGRTTYTLRVGKQCWIRLVEFGEVFIMLHRAGGSSLDKLGLKCQDAEDVLHDAIRAFQDIQSLNFWTSNFSDHWRTHRGILSLQRESLLKIHLWKTRHYDVGTGTSSTGGCGGSRSWRARSVAPSQWCTAKYGYRVHF